MNGGALLSGTGHCLCGAIGFSFDTAPNWQAHCHCESCRRNCSAPFTSYFGISHGHWCWTGEKPAVYASTPAVKRYFCPTCGTPMAYQSDRWPHEIHFYAASLSDPAGFEPTMHVNWNERLPWLHLSDDLPVRRDPRRFGPHDDPAPVLDLLRAAFAYMEGLIDPPSSLLRLDAAGLLRQAETGEIWLLEEAGSPIASIFLIPKEGRLYIGKLAVADGYRGQGLARQLVSHAGDRALALGLPVLELQSRVELKDNHAAFIAMGFAKTAETAHAGYDRPTSFTFAKQLG